MFLHLTYFQLEALEKTEFNLTIDTNPDALPNNSTTPSVGTHVIIGGIDFPVTASTREPNCPGVYVFDHWEGTAFASPDPNISTTVNITSDSTAIAVYNEVGACGDECHPIRDQDFDTDCDVDILDFAAFAAWWLDCTKPECDVW